jgi:hypothetical protein
MTDQVENDTKSSWVNPCLLILPPRVTILSRTLRVFWSQTSMARQRSCLRESSCRSRSIKLRHKASAFVEHLSSNFLYSTKVRRPWFCCQKISNYGNGSDELPGSTLSTPLGPTGLPGNTWPTWINSVGNVQILHPEPEIVGLVLTPNRTR